MDGESLGMWPFARLGRLALLLVGPFAMFAIWYVVNALGLVNPRLLPSPLRTLQSVWTNTLDGGLGADFLRTLSRTLQTFVIAAVAGVPIGIVIGSNERVYRSIECLVDFFRSLPATAMFPLFMVIFGLGDISKIAVAALAAWLVILFNVAYGVMNARRTRMLAARIMGASRLRVFRDVVFYESLPQTFVGLRTAASLGLVVVVVAEMFIGSDDGLGKRIIDSQITFDMPQLYGTILATGVLGYGLNLLFIAVERRYVHWAGRA